LVILAHSWLVSRFIVTWKIKFPQNSSTYSSA
jgi:hypothetical protein